MKQNLRTKSIKSILVLTLIIFSFSFFTACNEDQNPITPPPETTALSITHASPDAPNLDISVANISRAQNFSYLRTLPYIDLVPGLNRIVISTTNISTVLIDTTVFLQQDLFYSIFAIDSFANIRPLVLTDDLGLPGSTNSNIRFINLTPNLNLQPVDIQAQGKAIPWFPFYAFPQAAAYRPVTAGTYTIDMNLAGSSTTIFTLADVALIQGNIYTLISTGFDGASGPQALGLTLIQNYPF
ncbi:MAG: DUF4397 domain-containing protein [Bacteroidota bacterium]|nr:DUF4397 domain-containing protein [Bacteroidota bacterium]